MRSHTILGGILGVTLGGCGTLPAERAPAVQPQLEPGQPAAQSSLQTPARASAVMDAIQISLNRLGYRTGPVDGIYSVPTATAIRAYQRDHGLRESGRPSPDLADHMWSRGRYRAVGRAVDSGSRVQGSTS